MTRGSSGDLLGVEDIVNRKTRRMPAVAQRAPKARRRPRQKMQERHEKKICKEEKASRTHTVVTRCLVTRTVGHKQVERRLVEAEGPLREDPRRTKGGSGTGTAVSPRSCAGRRDKTALEPSVVERGRQRHEEKEPDLDTRGPRLRGWQATPQARRASDRLRSHSLPAPSNACTACSYPVVLPL